MTCLAYPARIKMLLHHEIPATGPFGVEIAPPRPLPKHIFKYVKPERVDILENEKILFSTVVRLNDPFEMRPRFPAPQIEEVQRHWENYVKGKYASLPAEVKLKWNFAKYKQMADDNAEKEMGSWEKRQVFMNESYGRQLPEMVQTAASNIWGILCLSEQIAVPNNLTMWAHYAEAHSGFAIQFDTTQEFFKDRFIWPVDYLSERPVFTRELSSLDTIKTVLVKSVEWLPEAEWRMFRSLKELEIMELPTGIGHFAALPPKTISAVFLGCKISGPHQEKILKSLKAPGREHIRAFKATLHPELYQLVFAPIN